MSNFLTYSNRLRQYVAALSPEQASDYINEAWRDIRDSDDEWSFLHRTEYWLAPDGITISGGVGVTLNSATVDLSVTAVGLLAGLNNPSLTVRQIRFSPSGGPIYSIASTDVEQVTDGNITASSTTLQCLTSAPFDVAMVGYSIIVVGAGVDGADLETTIASFTSTTEVELTDAASTTVTGETVSFGSTLTLDRLFREETNSAATAVIRRMYYTAEGDVARLDCVYDPFIGYELMWDIGTAEELNRIDPTRSAVGLPYRLYFREYDTTSNLPVYEMWPTPQSYRAYTVQYWARGDVFTEDDDALPPQIPEELLMIRARLLAYEWAMTNEPDSRKIAALAKMIQQMENRYSTYGQPGRMLGLLQQAKRKDHSIYRKSFIRRPRSGRVGYPLDSNWAQSHDVGYGGSTGYWGA
jgi:hypothetical protein